MFCAIDTRNRAHTCYHHRFRNAHFNFELLDPVLVYCFVLHDWHLTILIVDRDRLCAPFLWGGGGPLGMDVLCLTRCVANLFVPINSTFDGSTLPPSNFPSVLRADLAKTSPREVVLSAELFAIHLGAFLLGKYAHLHRAYVDVQQLRWQRIDVDGKPHKHSFWRDGDEKRVTSVEVIKPVEKGTDAKDNMVTKVVSGIKDLLGESSHVPDSKNIRVGLRIDFFCQ